MKLIIAEKPSLAKNIATALKVSKVKNGYIEGNGYIISWAFGHLFSLKNVDDYLGEKKKWNEVNLPFIPTEFEFMLKQDKKTKKTDSEVKKQFETLKSLANRKDVTEIVNCGDADREGQIIIDIILKQIRTNKKVTRLWLPEQTEDTIISSMQNIKDNKEYLNLYNEGIARTYIDWLMGINLTRYVSLKSNSIFPCGRVLIPIVKYIYDRDIARDNFVEEKYLILESKSKVLDQTINLSLKDIKYSLDNKEKAIEKANLLNKEKAFVKCITSKEVTKKPTKLFSLSKLQSKLSKEQNISFSKSLPIIQKLYEGGFITYPRTNTEYLAENEKSKVQTLISNLNKSLNLNLVFKDSKSIFDNSKIESHSAIIPTTKIPKDLKGLDKIVYDIILNRFISNFYDQECIIKKSEMQISVGEELIYLTGESIINEGYLKMEPERINNKLPNLTKYQEFDVKFIVSEKKTTIPKKVTESELANFLKNPFKNTKLDEEIEAMNEENDTDDYKSILNGIEIGTEATRTGIIQNAKLYKYITQDKQYFSIEPKGILLIELLDKLKIELYKEKTVVFSMIQKQVYKGTKKIDDVIAAVSDELNTIINRENIEVNSLIENSSEIINNVKSKSKEIIGYCPRCNYPIYENSKAFNCSNYKGGCKFALWKEDKFFTSRGKKITKAIATTLLNNNSVAVYKLKSKSGKEYNALFTLIDDGENIKFETKFIN